MVHDARALRELRFAIRAFAGGHVGILGHRMGRSYEKKLAAASSVVIFPRKAGDVLAASGRAAVGQGPEQAVSSVVSLVSDVLFGACAKYGNGVGVSTETLLHAQRLPGAVGLVFSE